MELALRKVTCLMDFFISKLSSCQSWEVQFTRWMMSLSYLKWSHISDGPLNALFTVHIYHKIMKRVQFVFCGCINTKGFCVIAWPVESFHSGQKGTTWAKFPATVWLVGLMSNLSQLTQWHLCTDFIFVSWLFFSPLRFIFALLCTTREA